MLALVIVDEINLRFRPKLLEEFVLKRAAPRKIAPSDLLVPGRQTDPQCSLHIEITESFSVRDRGCDDWILCTLFVLPGGKTTLKCSFHAARSWPRFGTSPETASHRIHWENPGYSRRTQGPRV